MKDFIVNIVQQDSYVQRLKNVLYTWLLNFTFKKAEKLKYLKYLFCKIHGSVRRIL